MSDDRTYDDLLRESLEAEAVLREPCPPDCELECCSAELSALFQHLTKCALCRLVVGAKLHPDLLCQDGFQLMKKAAHSVDQHSVDHE